MVLDISHWENPPPPQIRSYGWIYCVKMGWVCVEMCLCVVLNYLGSALFSLCFHEDLKLREESLVKKHEEIIIEL